jgi:hypothetical protein
MSTSTAPRHEVDLGVDQPRRLSTETKAAIKTTEFFVFIAAVLAVVITANVYDGNGSDGDPFGATTAIRYVVYLTIAYLVARGLAKSGSREHYDA